MTLRTPLSQMLIVLALVLQASASAAIDLDDIERNLNNICVGLARTMLAEAKRQERVEQFALAAVRYNEILKLDGDSCDLSDIKAMAGFSLCGVRIYHLDW
jgi:hypothetical protein